MSEANYPPGMISLAYHIIFSDELRDEFREFAVDVEMQFLLGSDAMDAIKKVTQSGSGTPQDAQALAEFMSKELSENIDAPLSGAGVHSGSVLPPGLLSAIYHVFIARKATSLSVFDLSSAEERAIRDKDVVSLVTLLNAEFSQRFSAVYANVW
jgi:hypothetical protein